MAKGPKYTWEETLATFALYLLLPSGQHHKGNEDVIALANALGRSPSSISFKLGNIKSHDPSRQGTGLPNGSKLDGKVWEVYSERGDALTEEALDLLINAISPSTAGGMIVEYLSKELPEGKERTVVATARANQTYFRRALLDNYHKRCCLTGLSVEQLLVASHIKPWSVADPVTERLSPENGLLLDALHDRAFDKGLMTIDFDLRVVVSRKVPKDKPGEDLLWCYNGRRIEVPGRFKPRKEFIEYHNDVVFKR